MVALAGTREAALRVDTARALNPQLRIVVRAPDEESALRLQRAGAQHTVQAEITLAQALTQRALEPVAAE